MYFFCPVFVNDSGAAYDPCTVKVSAEQCQMRSKQEKLDPSFQIEPDNLRDDRKGRVVDHHAIIGIDQALVITTRIERADNGHPVDVAMIGYILQNIVVHRWRRIAVVGRFLGIEFFHKALVIVENTFLRLSAIREHVLLLAE